MLPGWGFDVRIFELLDLDFNYLLPQRIDTVRFNAALISWLKREGMKEVSLFGWSMGGFLALDFLKEYGEVVTEVFLVSMRARFPKEQVDTQKALLMEDHVFYLSQFYRNCFMGQKRAFKWFKENLLSSYIKIFDLHFLLRGLDYLARQALRPSVLNKYPIRLVHGKKDRIAPFAEISESMAEASFPFIVFDKSGHLPFLEPHFKEKLSRGI